LLTKAQSVAIPLACVLIVLLLMWILNRLWPAARRRDHNDIIGWQVGVLGTTYAVVMGFMLYAVWSSFQEADVNAATEANCLVAVFRLSNGLPAAQRDEVHRLARQYVNIVIDDEWPAMQRGQLSSSAHDSIDQLWATILQTKPATFAEQDSMNLTLTQMSDMIEHRRLRELESQSNLPGILWAVLIVGAGITVLSACLFGLDNFVLHSVQVLSLTLLLSLTLVAIAAIDRPFRGAVPVLPNGFELARDTFAQLP
jgi:hypothetical protein